MQLEMKRSILGTLGALIATAPIPSAAAPPDAPNLVIVIADDLGEGQIARIGSPEIAQFAAQGLTFRNSYAGSALCAPSRAALLTGQHTGHVTPRGNWRMRLDQDVVTIAEMLRDAGYVTGLFGKWGFGDRKAPETWPERHGWTEYLAYLSHKDAHDHTPAYLWQNGKQLDLSGGYAQDLFDNSAESFIDRNADRPFLLYVSSALPHVPLEIPAATNAASPSVSFAAMVRRFGKTVGRIESAIDEHGMADRTLILVTSDNGAASIDASAAWASDLRGAKGELYEGGIRVPLIARWPGQIAPGATDSLVAAWDIYATAAALAGVETQSDGASILRGHDDRALYFELQDFTTAQAVRWGRWKAIRAAPNEPVELYDLVADPGERKDIAGKRPELVSKAIGVMEAEHAPDEHWPMRERTIVTKLQELYRRLIYGEVN